MTNIAQITGIIAEYNPFHNGHLYQMRIARARSGASWCVVFLSGSHVQRGIPAAFGTALRAEAALRCGADAVFEIPAPFSTASAADYALYGVSLAASLGIRCLSCGAESASSEELSLLSDCIGEESSVFRQTLKESLKNGMTYPKARLLAAEAELSSLGAPADLLVRTEALLSLPNNILAFEYIRAAKKLDPEFRVITVPRKGAGYHDPILNGSFSSASALRQELLNGTDAAELDGYMPAASAQVFAGKPSLSPDCLCGPVSRKIRDLIYEGSSLSRYADVSEDLAARLKDADLNFRTWEDLVNAVKTRQYTHTRISRALLHIFLGIKKEDMEAWKNAPVPYARLIGFRRDSEELLSVLKARAAVPILTRPAAADSVLTDPAAKKLFLSEVHATELRNSLYYEKTGIRLPDYYRQQIVIT